MRVFRQIASLIFSALVFISSSSFSVGVHVCMGRVNAVAFLSQADGCGHSEMPPCHRKLMAGCCQDETISYDAQGFNADSMQIDIAAPAFEIVQAPTLLAEIIPSALSSQATNLPYDPPLRSTDIPIINQSFLI